VFKKLIFTACCVDVQHNKMGWTNLSFLHIIARELEMFLTAVQCLFDLCGEEIWAHCLHITGAPQLSLCHHVRSVLLRSALAVV
jgi:hypothetical protein